MKSAKSYLSSKLKSIKTLGLTVFLGLSFPGVLPGESGLAENSPFLPPGHGKEEEKPKAPVIQSRGPISQEIEFRGFMQMDGEYQVSIFNKKEQRGYWLKENETEDGISIRDFDAETATIVVGMNGRSERLNLMEATDSPIPVNRSSVQSGGTARRAVLPTRAESSSNTTTRRKVVPRRRVILPKKN